MTKDTDALREAARKVAHKAVMDAGRSCHPLHYADKAVDAIFASLPALATPASDVAPVGEEWGGPLTPSEQARIDAAWEKHKAAGDGQ